MALSNEKETQLRKRLIEFFRHRNCKFTDDLADETLYRLRAKQDAGTEIPAADIERYAIGIAKNVWHEGIRNPLNFSDPVDDLQSDNATEKKLQPKALKREAIQEQQLLDEAEELCLNKCLNKLPNKERRLILEYYKDGWHEQSENRKRLMKTMDISSGTLASKVARIREILRKCIQRCLGVKK
ncbi:MAG: RNA polymerase sigma factor [Blastocatellia bacterium]